MVESVTRPEATTPPPLTRTGLYERVWEEPMRVIATRYGISDVGLAKMCKRYRIPIPGRGYWQKLKAGKPVKRPPLKPFPAWTHGVDVELLVYRAAVENVRPVSTVVVVQQSYEQDPANLITVASTVEAAGKLHPLVKRTRAAFGKLQKESTALTVPKGENVLDIRVTPALVDRGLLLLDALIKALESRGYSVQSRAPRPVWRRFRGMSEASWTSRIPGLMTCVQIGDQDVLLMLREHQRKVMIPPLPPKARRFSWDSRPTQELVGSGRLVLTIQNHVGGWSRGGGWVDSDRVKLEGQLNDVIVGIVAAAEEYRVIVAQWREEERAAEEAALLRLKAEQQKAAEAALAKELERQATDWDLAKTIREYIVAVRLQQNVDNTLSIAPRGMDTASWLAWAEAYADRVDPLVRVK